jgi:23S rRNA (uridine2552-2'-O)-methyltransferase
MKRQVVDRYVLQARRENYRSRAAYKLKQMDAKLRPKLLRRGQVALELGAAPGSWSQVMVEAGMRVVGCDLLSCEPIEEGNFTFVQGDFSDAAIQQALLDALAGPADLIVSDISPNRSGHRSLDEFRLAEYAEQSLDLAHQCLRPGGSFLCKLLQGAELQPLLKRVKPLFGNGSLIKPPASRQKSAEVYFCARDFNPKG